MNFKKHIIVFFIILSFSFCARSQSQSFLNSKELEEYLNTINIKKGFNGEILVAKNNEIIFQKTIGFSSMENQVELNKNAKYFIASITKSFTGTLIAIAQKEGKLNVQEKAINYIDDLSLKFKEITIQQLLNHTSGVPHNEGINDYWLVKSTMQLSKKQIINEINALDLLYKPGSKITYSSLGYYMLSTILENVYKNTFHNILEEKILKPLGMVNTGIVGTLKIIPQMTSGYHLINDDSLVVAPYRNYSILKGAGDMYSTTEDLLKWCNSFFTNSILNEKDKEIIFSNSNAENNYDYGWYTQSEKIKKHYHGGGTWGYSTHIALYPEEKISVIILSNISSLPISSIAEDIESIVFGLSFHLPTIEKEISNDSKSLDLYQGKYKSDSNKMELIIKQTNDKLYAQLRGNPPFEIYSKGNHQFFGKKVEVEFIFELHENIVTGLRANRMGQSFLFKKSIN